MMLNKAARPALACKGCCEMLASLDTRTLRIFGAQIERQLRRVGAPPRKRLELDGRHVVRDDRQQRRLVDHDATMYTSRSARSHPRCSVAVPRASLGTSPRPDLPHGRIRRSGTPVCPSQSTGLAMAMRQRDQELARLSQHKNDHPGGTRPSGPAGPRIA